MIANKDDCDDEESSLKMNFLSRPDNLPFWNFDAERVLWGVFGNMYSTGRVDDLIFGKLSNFCPLGSF